MPYKLLKMLHIPPDDQKMTDTHTDVQTHNTHSSNSTEPFQITAPSLIPSGCCSWSKAWPQKPGGGLEHCQQLGPFQKPHVLFMETHRLSSLIRQSSPQTSGSTHVGTHAHTQTNQGHQANRDLICRNMLIKFASIWCVHWICECGCVCEYVCT